MTKSATFQRYPLLRYRFEQIGNTVISVIIPRNLLLPRPRQRNYFYCTSQMRPRRLPRRTIGRLSRCPPCYTTQRYHDWWNVWRAGGRSTARHQEQSAQVRVPQHGFWPMSCRCLGALLWLCCLWFSINDVMKPVWDDSRAQLFAARKKKSLLDALKNGLPCRLGVDEPWSNPAALAR